jgi:ubiquinone/menaquinone biosynthesis C-methylase UbiE
MSSLNLGCGDQPNCDIRVDMRKTKTNNIKSRLDSDLPFNSETFTFVYERNLLEHLGNPEQHLKEIYRILKPKGAVELTTDNASCMRYYLNRGTHMGGYHGHRKYLSTDVEDHHYCIFTLDHIRNLFTKAGFKIIKIEYVDTDYFTYYFDRVIRCIPFLKQFSYPRIYVVATK